MEVFYILYCFCVPRGPVPNHPQTNTGIGDLSSEGSSFTNSSYTKFLSLLKMLAQMLSLIGKIVIFCVEFLTGWSLMVKGDKFYVWLGLDPTEPMLSSLMFAVFNISTLTL